MDAIFVIHPPAVSAELRGRNPHDIQSELTEEKERQANNCSCEHS